MKNVQIHLITPAFLITYWIWSVTFTIAAPCCGGQTLQPPQPLKRPLTLNANISINVEIYLCNR